MPSVRPRSRWPRHGDAGAGAIRRSRTRRSRPRRRPRRYSPTTSAPGGQRQRQPAGEPRVDLDERDAAPSSATKPCTLAGPVSPTAASASPTTAVTASEVERRALDRDAGLGLVPPARHGAGQRAVAVDQRVRGELPPAQPGLRRSAPAPPRAPRRARRRRRPADDVAAAAPEARLDDPRPGHVRSARRGPSRVRRPRRPRSARRRRHLSQQAVDGVRVAAARSRTPASASSRRRRVQRRHLLGHRADQRGARRCRRRAPQTPSTKSGSSPRGQHGAERRPGAARRRRASASAATTRAAGQRADDRDAGRAAGAGDEDGAAAVGRAAGLVSVIAVLGRR